MSKFLLKQMEQLTAKAVDPAPTAFYKSSIFTSSILAVAAAVVMSSAYAGVQLSDAELDSKFIEVQIRQICTLEKEKVDTKKSAYITEDSKSAQYVCRTDDLFVTTINTDGSRESADKTADSTDSSALLAGILQNLRSLGGGEFLGLPAGVSNTGNPIGFGSELYSYAWAGNLGDIFQVPYYENGYWNSIYDTSSLGYGFRAEAHFPNGPPPSPTISFNLTRRN